MNANRVIGIIVDGVVLNNKRRPARRPDIHHLRDAFAVDAIALDVDSLPGIRLYEDTAFYSIADDIDVLGENLGIGIVRHDVARDITWHGFWAVDIDSLVGVIEDRVVRD